MSQVTSPVILDSTGQDIVTQLAAISAAIASGVVITGNTDITLSGVLQGLNGKVASIPVDNAPTDNSTNLVSSGGVKSALDTKTSAAQLAYVVTGTTASDNYPKGAYISWNGLLYTADTAISYGTTLAADGGNKNVTLCVNGGFNNLAFPTARTGSFTSDNYSVEWFRYGYVCTIRVYRNSTATTNITLTTPLPAEAIPAVFIAVPQYAIDGGYIQISENDGKITVRQAGNAWFSATATYLVKANT